MPTTINEQNARQIRQPMDVLITMQVPDDDIDLSFSGYMSTAKVADGKLNEPSWPMRTLADLQGDGFALHGSAVLYDPNASASASNGKIGVRGNIGQAVNVTVTSDNAMIGLTLLVTGAESVTYNGYSHDVTSGRVSFLVGGTTASLTLAPKEADARIQLSLVQTSTNITITRDNLISCIVSLRSDLSIIDPTLPESELNIEAYFVEDVSSAMALIPDDTPIYYQAGYGGDMSPVRNFYVAGQVTWADSVLNIHAVDAVHFLDRVVVPRMIPNDYRFSYAHKIGQTLWDWLQKLGLKGESGYPYPIFYRFNESTSGLAYHTALVTADDLSLREYIAFCMNMIRFRGIDPSYLSTTGYGRDYIIDYVDAGIPNLRVTPSYREPTQPEWSINEGDCGDVVRSVDRKSSSLRMQTKRLKASGNSAINEGSQPVGTARWAKGVGISLDLDTPCMEFAVAVQNTVLPNRGNWPWTALAPVTSFGWMDSSISDFNSSLIFGETSVNPIAVGGLPNNTLQSKFSYDGHDFNGGVLTSFIPWDSSYFDISFYQHLTMAANWNALVSRGVIESGANEWSCDIRGVPLNSEDTVELVGTGSEEAATDIAPKLLGSLLTPKGGAGATAAWEMYPKSSLENLLERSPVTGSFTWKGDPRMQPRDIIHFHRLDGTVEDITIESITLKHEGGGTTAEITYRKGII